MPTPPPKKKPAPVDPVEAAKAYLAGLEGSSQPWGGPAQALPPPAAGVALPGGGTSFSNPAVAAGADIPTNGGLPPIGTEALDQANRLRAMKEGVASRANPNGGAQGHSILDALLGLAGK